MGILAELGIKQLHQNHIEHLLKAKSVNKTIKHEFQDEASMADFHTIEELNSAFWAWSEVVYNKRVHSATGETPNDRFLKGLPKDHKRITDLESFDRMFLWKDDRTVSKYGRIKLYSNQYPIEKAPHGKVVQVRFDPFNLDEVYIYDSDNRYLETTSCSKKVTTTAPNIPEESKASHKKVSKNSKAFFTRLREKHLKELKKTNQIPFSKLFKKEEQNNEKHST